MNTKWEWCARRTSLSQQRGFTLLELVLVVFIMGTLAAVSLSFIEKEDGHHRYEESLQKMTLIDDALLGIRSHGDQSIMSGFIFDNGTLPPTDTPEIALNPLINFDDTASTGWAENSGEKWDLYGSKNPIYEDSSQSPATNETLTEQIYKGYRGPYVHAHLDSQNEFRDGWGREFDIDDSTSETYKYELAANAVSGPIEHEVGPNDWRVDLFTLQVTVTNNLAAELGTDHTAAILIYENSAVAMADKWTTYYFNLSNLAVGASETSSPTTAWLENGVAVTVGSTIPVGVHPIVVFNESSDAVRDFQTLHLFPRSSTPTISLEVTP